MKPGYPPPSRRWDPFLTPIIGETIMANVLKNLKKIVVNTVSATVELASVTVEVAADSTDVLSQGVRATPSVVKSVMTLPMDASEGYMVANGATQEEAHEQAYKLLNQPVATTITNTSQLLGAGLAALMEEDEDALETTEDLMKLTKKELIARMK